MKIKQNPDVDIVKYIREKLKENDGYCPCRITKSPENKCICKEFLDFVENGGIGKCHCGLYMSVGE